MFFLELTAGCNRTQSLCFPNIPPKLNGELMGELLTCDASKLVVSCVR